MEPDYNAMDPDFNDYTPIGGFMNLVHALYNNPENGTGVGQLINLSHNILGPRVPDIIIVFNIGLQNQIFGGYPDQSVMAPSVALATLFGVLGLVHTALFCINFSRGHYFYPSFGWIAHCVGRMLGFAMWASWGHDITTLKVGMAAEFFMIVPSYVLVSFNLILSQRLFTWRHPVGGSRMLFWNFMFALYGLVLIIIAVTAMASFIPYSHYLGHRAYFQWQNVVQATSILIILYTLTSIILIGLSYFFKPTKKDESLYTYQPWWIESFSPFYFVRKNAARDAEETFMKRNHNHRHAIRVIAATHHHHNMVEGLSNERGGLKHNVSLMILFVTTLIILVPSILRAITVFGELYNHEARDFTKRNVMFVCWGGLEALISLIYLVARVDLRFYRPDILPAKVRAIVTAEQSGFMSHVVSDSEEEISMTPPSPAPSFNFGRENEKHTLDHHDSEEKYDYTTNDNESDFRF